MDLNDSTFNNGNFCEMNFQLLQQYEEYFENNQTFDSMKLKKMSTTTKISKAITIHED